MVTAVSNPYQEIVRSVSALIAGEFLKNETWPEKRALLLDDDISEITRQVGLETTKIVIEETLVKLTEKKKRKV